MTDIEKNAREYAGDAIFNAEWNDIEYACEAEKAEEDMKKAFLAGAAYALGNQWRDAEKEKPEDGKKYVIVDKDGNMRVGVYDAAYKQFEMVIGSTAYVYRLKTTCAFLPIPEYEPKGE